MMKRIYINTRGGVMKCNQSQPSQNSYLTSSNQCITLDNISEPDLDFDDQSGVKFSMYQFYDGLTPLIFSMRIWGLFHSPGRSLKCRLSFIYSCAVLILLWLNFIRYFGMYTYTGAFSDGLFFKVVVHVFVFQTCVSVSQCFYASRNLPTFLKTWEKLKLHQHGTALQQHSMKRNSYIYAFVCFLFLCTNTVILGVWLFTPFSHKDVSGQPFYPAGTRPSIPFSVFYLIVHTFMCAAWIYAGFFFVAFCIGIRKEFILFTKDFQSVISDGGILDERFNIEEFRRRHEEICHLVQAADRMFSVYTLTVYGSNLTKACFVMYHLVTHPVEAPINILTHLYWLVISIAYMYLITIPGAMLNSAAMAPARILYRMKLKSPHMTVENICQVSVFLTKLYQDHIGFTSYHLFVINRHTIITVAALVVSYILVLLKVGSSMDTGGTSLHQNITWQS